MSYGLSRSKCGDGLRFTGVALNRGPEDRILAWAGSDRDSIGLLNHAEQRPSWLAGGGWYRRAADQTKVQPSLCKS